MFLKSKKQIENINPLNYAQFKEFAFTWKLNG